MKLGILGIAIVLIGFFLMITDPALEFMQQNQPMEFVSIQWNFGAVLCFAGLILCILGIVKKKEVEMSEETEEYNAEAEA